MRQPDDFPWTADIESIYTSIHEITPHDEATFRDANYSEEQLLEAFKEGFLTHSDDPYVSRDDRRIRREEFFEWMEYLGYNRDDFDWEAWKEHFWDGES